MRPILEVIDLIKTFRMGSGLFARGEPSVAVDGVSFAVARGTTLGIVGESGSGKSTTAKIICRLEDADQGQVLIDGENILGFRGAAARAITRRIQIVFQDPGSSLNPRWKVGDLIAEGLVIHRRKPGRRDAAVADLLDRCGLVRAAAGRYPHEFSGGQRQRIAIARALAVEPDILVLDEPVSALDVSVQAQVLALLEDLQRDLDLTYVLIAHDLAVVDRTCDDVIVMHNGRIVEHGHPNEIINNPRDPYTRKLIDAHPDPDPRRRSTRGRIERERENEER